MSEKSKFLSTFLAVAVMLTLVITMSFIGCKKAEEVVAPAEEEVVEEEAAPAAEEEVAKKPFEGVEITVINMLEWPVVKGLWELLPEFTEKTGIKVNIADYPFEELKEVQIREGEARSGAIDVLHIFEFGMATMQRYAMSLDDMIERDFGMDAFKANYAPGAIQYGTFDGELYFVGSVGGIQVGGYRKELFEDPAEQAAFKEEYGYDLKPPTTIQERLDVAEFFTRDTDNDGEIDLWGLLIPGAGEHGMTLFEYYEYTTGVKLYLSPEGEFLFGNDKPEARDKVIEVATMDQDLIYKYKVAPPGAAGMQLAEISEMYFAGQGAMIESWLHDFWNEMKDPDMVAKIGETGTYLLPPYVEGNPGWVGFWGWGVSKDSKNPEAAWEFIKWVTSLDTAKKWIPNAGAVLLPPQKDVQEWGVGEGLFVPAQVEATATAEAVVTLPEVDLIRKGVRQYHELLMANAMTPTEFVDKIISDAEEILGQ